MNSDDESNEAKSWRGIPGTVVLINAFEAVNCSAAAVAHNATCRMVRQYMREANFHNVAVCLYGVCDTDPTSLGTKNVHDIMPLSSPTLDDFLKLRHCNPSTYKPAQEFQLSDVLWHCSKLFANCKKLLSTRTVLMLTKLHVPPVQADQKPTLKRVVDLVDSNIDIKIINISENEYKVDPFYINFLIEANKGKDYLVPKPIWDPKEIEKIMHQQIHRHLAVAQLNFEIGDGFEIGVGVYNLVKKSGQFYHKKINLERETNSVVASVTKTLKVPTVTLQTNSAVMEIDEGSEPKALPLLNSEILYCQNYGGENVGFTNNEQKKLQNFGPPVMKLLGFKPARFMCKEKWFLKGGAFLYPNDKTIEGSTTAFKAFHQACMETATVAVCVLCTRVNAKPNIVALSPCTHPLGMDIEIGFDIINIPFAESVRDLPADEDEENSPVISEDQKTLMKHIMKSLKFDYKADMFENPKVQSEYRAVEAKALEDEDLEPFVDTTKPKPEVFESVPGDQFEELFGPFAPIAPKRPTSTTAGGTAAKKPKGFDVFDETTLSECIRHGTLNQYTVAQLKELLKRKQQSGGSGMPALTGLKKDELVSLVQRYYS